MSQHAEPGFNLPAYHSVAGFASPQNILKQP
jgi:hypothetical protein